MTDRDLEVEGRRVRITHPDKVLFPGDGITKLDLADYYLRVAPVMLPHIRDRPLTQHRWPEGLGGTDFWHKQIPKYFPEWIDRVEVETNKGPQQQVVANEPGTMAYLVNQNCITPHVWLSRRPALHRPDELMFDLDPAGPRDFATVRAGARFLRDVLQDLGLTPFVKTTGSKGLHVVAPIRPSSTFEKAHEAALAVAAILLDDAPDRFTLEFYKEKRRGRVFVDVHRNAYAQTAVPPYAVRARRGAPVAAPVTWDELGRVTPERFTIRNLFRRLSRRNDPWADIDRQAGTLDGVVERLRG
ncbi:MAG TPA: non-homologous end-joining DNA ligase [Actinomycetota bacterium]|nr:non-homologous end-joining DNA ligase [Actinomycetota bacterium]